MQKNKERKENMIQAVADKIVVEQMIISKTKSGILLPGGGVEPQAYGKVLSCGELVTEGTEVKEGDILVFHPGAGMAVVLEKRVLKVLKYEELYGILQSEEVKENLKTMVISGSTEGETLVKPASDIIKL